MLLFTFLLLLLIPATSSLSFNMSSISFADSGRFNITGDASISDQGIQVTPDEPDSSSSGGRAGRAVYSEPLHLWDQASRNLTDFYTHFSFLIDSNGSVQPRYGDGLAFFLAPLGSSIPSGSYGGGLGLGEGSTGTSVSSFVALEFDTFLNPDFDPAYVPHVGIDINSMRSVTTAKWDNNISYGVANDVWIIYTASSRLLKADFTGNGTQRGSLTYEVDLRDHLPEYVAFGFSAATGVLFEKHNIKSWDFSSTLQSDSSGGGNINNPKKKNKALEALKFLGALVVVLVIPLWCLRKNKTVVRAGNECGALLRAVGKALAWVWSKCIMALLRVMGKAIMLVWNKCRELRGGDASMDEEFSKGSGPRKFSYTELVRATDNFKETLGRGGFGTVYRGLLKETGEAVAVKRVSKESSQGKNEYEAEVKIISQLRHINLVQLSGWCHQRKELLLVYELMPNGSLDSHLFREEPPLMSWETRYRVARGVATALLYLHEGVNPSVLHRDIKASNIMLDSEFEAKLGDFGLARLLDRDRDCKTTMPRGTLGYVDPEHCNGEKASKANDVYSFGIVLLELACGRAAIVDGEALVGRVRQFERAGQLLEAADQKLGPLSESDAAKVLGMLGVGLRCAQPDSIQRPTTVELVQDLNAALKIL